MKLAFYKGPGNWTDKLIRYWTESKYSHCEIVINGLWYTSSWYDGGVRRLQLDYNPDNWDFIELTGYDESVVIDFYHNTKGMPYDLKGIILSQILPLNKNSKAKWFCSEWCATALGLSITLISPEKLYNIFKGIRNAK